MVFAKGSVAFPLVSRNHPPNRAESPFEPFGLRWGQRAHGRLAAEIMFGSTSKRPDQARLSIRSARINAPGVVSGRPRGHACVAGGIVHTATGGSGQRHNPPPGLWGQA